MDCVHAAGGALLYLGEPEEVLHEGAAVGIVHLHDGDLVLRCHQ